MFQGCEDDWRTVVHNGFYGLAVPEFPGFEFALALRVTRRSIQRNLARAVERESERDFLAGRVRDPEMRKEYFFARKR
jgi:hypothetical protein